MTAAGRSEFKWRYRQLWVEILQRRGAEKRFCNGLGVPPPAWAHFDALEEVAEARQGEEIAVLPMAVADEGEVPVAAGRSGAGAGPAIFDDAFAGVVDDEGSDTGGEELHPPPQQRDTPLDDAPVAALEAPASAAADAGAVKAPSGRRGSTVRSRRLRSIGLRSLRQKRSKTVGPGAGVRRRASAAVPPPAAAAAPPQFPMIGPLGSDPRNGPRRSSAAAASPFLLAAAGAGLLDATVDPGRRASKASEAPPLPGKPHRHHHRRSSAQGPRGSDVGRPHAARTVRRKAPVPPDPVAAAAPADSDADRSTQPSPPGAPPVDDLPSAPLDDDAEAAAGGWIDAPPACLRGCACLVRVCGRHPTQKATFVARRRAAAVKAAAARAAIEEKTRRALLKAQSAHGLDSDVETVLDAIARVVWQVLHVAWLMLTCGRGGGSRTLQVMPVKTAGAGSSASGATQLTTKVMRPGHTLQAAAEEAALTSRRCPGCPCTIQVRAVNAVITGLRIQVPTTVHLSICRLLVLTASRTPASHSFSFTSCCLASTSRPRRRRTSCSRGPGHRCVRR